MPFFAQNGHEKRGSCSPTVNLKAVESYLKVGGYAPEYANRGSLPRVPCNIQAWNR